VILAGQATDITEPVVEAYNMLSGVSAPTAGSNSSKPTRTATTKPAAPSSRRRNSSDALWYFEVFLTNESRSNAALLHCKSSRTRAI
jgi:hypothetical protein